MRLVIAGVIVLGMLYVAGRTLVGPLVPALAATVHVIDPDFTVLSASVGQHGAMQTVAFRADLAGPLELAGRTLYPLGWNTAQPQGWFQIDLSLGGLLQYSALLLIIVLGWPARKAREFALRLALCLPLAALLVFIAAPSTVIAELWKLLGDQFAPGEVSGWLVWSRFLMGGGGLAIAGILAAGVIVVAQRRQATHRAGFA
ncbi:MAG TPA: hypothetical protein VMC02_06565 [Steroidobacteraceae bacterium]|nr:hypothetical protein [Steroidobacteraceae bacterium]